MRIINTEKFSVPLLSTDRLIQKKIKEHNHQDEYTLKLKSDGDNTYTISYSSLLNNLISSNKNETIDILDSIFYQPKFTNGSVIKRIELWGNEVLLSWVDNTDQKDEVFLGFNFWCNSPAVFSTTYIKLFSLSHINEVEFNTKIVRFDKNEFNSIACNSHLIKTIDNRNILVSGGCFREIEDEHIKGYSKEIDHVFVTPYVQHPNKVKIKIWGQSLDSIRDIAKNIPQFINEVSDSSKPESNGIGSGVVGDKLPWVEFMVQDDNMEYILYHNKSVMYFFKTNIEYTPPQSVIDMYTDKANKIAREKYLWNLSANDDYDKPTKTLKQIEQESNEYETCLINDINGFLATEQRYDTTGFLNTYNQLEKVAQRVEVSQVAILTMPTIHYITVFYNNKMVEYKEMYAADILLKYRDIMDETTVNTLIKWNS